MINIQNVKEAVLDPKKGIKSFFVQSNKVKAGSVTYLPSPSHRDKEHLNKSKLDLPISRIFNDIMIYAEGMKEDIDVSKTLDEMNMIKKMENQ